MVVRTAIREFDFLKSSSTRYNLIIYFISYSRLTKVRRGLTTFLMILSSSPGIGG